MAISIPTITSKDLEDTHSQEVTKQSRNFKNLDDDDLSNKILNSFLETDIFFDNACKFSNKIGEERIDSIKKVLRSNHLNQYKYEHVERFIINNADRFQIPGEPLEATDVLQQ